MKKVIDMNLAQAIEHAKAKAFERPVSAGRLAGKVALVTGAAQGFGLEIAKRMHREGASVMLADLPSQAAKAEVEAEILGEAAAFCAVDITSEASVEAMACECTQRFGGIDILISNAGILRAGTLEDLDIESFETVTKVNYTGYFLCVKYVSEIMKARFAANPGVWSDIIQINSKSGLVGSKNNFAYAGSKFGAIGLTQSFALELVAYQIKVNAVCPGNYYDGPLWSDPENGLFTQYLRAGKVPGARTVDDVKAFYLSKSPIHRGCMPDDVAKAVFYCVEQEFETGQAIPVTGGQVMLA